MGAKDGRMAHDIDSERLNNLRTILRDTNLRLLQQMLASPTGALSALELAARNGITESTIRDHIRTLQSCDPPIVRTLETEIDEGIPHGIPHRYYAVTEYGIELLKQVGHYDQIGLLYDVYEAASLELPDSADREITIEDVEEYPYRPVPEWL